MKQIPQRLFLRAGITPVISLDLANGQILFRKAAQVIREGMYPAFVLVLLTLAVNLFEQPVLVLFGDAGVLVYIFAVLAIGIFALDRSIQMKYNEYIRAWCGSLAGLLVWFVIEGGMRLGRAQFSTDATLILIILGILVVMTLWKQIFPIGLKFFAVGLLLNLAVHFMVAFQVVLANQFTFFDTTLVLSGFITLVGWIFSILWMAKADSKIYRMWAAQGVWISSVAAMLIFFNLPV